MTDIASHLRQLDDEGYTVVPGFLDRSATAAIRDHLDRLLPPVQPREARAEKRLHVLRHPISGPIMARLASYPPLLELALATLKARGVNDLLLLEQVLIRTDPSPPPYGPSGWHIDWAFTPAEYEATPRQTYYHMIHCCSTVAPGGGAFTIVPASHRLTYAAAAKARSDEDLAAFKRDPAAAAGIDTGLAREVCAQDGDLLIFNPMCLHSASHNATDQPRYAYFASFFDRSAQKLWAGLRRDRYRDRFPRSLHEGLPENLRHLLES